MKNQFPLWRELLYIGTEDPPPTGGGGTPALPNQSTVNKFKPPSNASESKEFRQAIFLAAKQDGLSDKAADRVAEKMFRIYGDLNPKDPKAAAVLGSAEYKDVYEDAVRRELILENLWRMGVNPKAQGKVEDFIRNGHVVDGTQVGRFIQQVNSEYEKQDFDTLYKGWVDSLNTPIDPNTGRPSQYDAAIFSTMREMLLDDTEASWAKYVKWRNDAFTTQQSAEFPELQTQFADTSIGRYLTQNAKSLIMGNFDEATRNNSAIRAVAQNAYANASLLLQTQSKLAEQRDKARQAFDKAVKKLNADYVRAVERDMPQADALGAAFTELSGTQTQFVNDYVDIAAPAGLTPDQYVEQRLGQDLQRALSATPYAASVNPQQFYASLAGVTAAGKAEVDKQKEAEKAATQTQANQAVVSGNAPIALDEKGNPVVDKKRQQELAQGQGGRYAGVIDPVQVFSRVEAGELSPSEAAVLFQQAATQGLATRQITGDAASELHRFSGVVAGYDITSNAALERNPVGFFNALIRRNQAELASQTITPERRAELERQTNDARVNMTAAQQRLATPAGNLQQQQIIARQTGEPYDLLGARAANTPFANGVNPSPPPSNVIQPARNPLSEEEARILRESGEQGLAEERERKRQAALRAQRQGT
jgi:hypothetical protein